MRQRRRAHVDEPRHRVPPAAAQTEEQRAQFERRLVRVKARARARVRVRVRVGVGAGVRVRVRTRVSVRVRR